MERLSKDEYGCLLALSASTRSEDPHTRVGAAAMTVEGRIIGLSYNGLKSGMIKPSWMDEEENRQRKGELMIHAEQNIVSLIKRGECHTLYLTISPCIGCCNTIASHEIKRVVYLKEYHRCSKFKDFLSFYGIKYEELDIKGKNNIISHIDILKTNLVGQINNYLFDNGIA
jgi:deoxycytidylate deaminase